MAVGGFDRETCVVQVAGDNVIRVITFRNLSLGIDYDAKFIDPIIDVGDINPLAINIVLIVIATIHAYTLIASVLAVEYFRDPFFAFGIFQAEAGFVSFSYLRTVRS